MKPEFVIDSLFVQCVGIDISKEKFTACLCMASGYEYSCKSPVLEFPNTKTGFNQLVKWSRKESLKEVECCFLMEATGVYYESLAYHLHKLGLQVFVVLPSKAKAFAEYQYIWTKTYIMDSRVLAYLGCVERRLRPWDPPPLIYRELRQMCRFRTNINKQRMMLSNQLEALNNSVGPEKSIIQYYEKLILQIDRQIDSNEQNMREKVKKDAELSQRIEKLETIKGVGFITIVCVLAETQGFALINNRKQLTSYAGLDVLARQSGGIDKKHRISKKGNSRIRAALYMPSIVAAHYNKPLKETYERIVKKNPKQKKIAIIAVERKLLLLMYTLWRKGETFKE